MKDEATGVMYNTRSDYDKAMLDTFNKGIAKESINPTDVSSSKAIKLPGKNNLVDKTTSNLSMGVNAIPVSKLTKTSSDADVMSALGYINPQEQARLGYAQKIGEGLKKLLGKSEKSADLYEDAGLEEKQNNLQSLDNDIAGEQRALDKELRRLSDNPFGMSTNALTSEMNRVRGDSLERQADLSIIKAGVQGDITTAQSIIQQKLDMEFAPVEEEIQYYTQLLELSDMESGILDKKEKDQLNFILNERQTAMDEAKAEKKTRYELASQLASTDPAAAKALLSGQMTIEEGIMRSGNTSSGTDTDNKDIESFYKDVQSYVEKLGANSMSWATAFNALKARYPQASNELIDQTLGKNNYYEVTGNK